MALGIGLATYACLVGIAAPRVSSEQSQVEMARTPVLSQYDRAKGLGLSSSQSVVGDKPWTQVEVTGASTSSPLPPGLIRWPAPGTTVVSPALRSLAARDTQLRGQLGRLAADTIGPAGLTSPDELFSYTVVTHAVTGAHAPGTKAAQPGPVVVDFGNSRMVTASTSASFLIIEIAVLVLTPAAVFLLTALRLSAVSRSRRAFALGLAGMSPSTSARIYGWEMGAVAVAGYAAGATAYAGSQAALGYSGWLGIRWWPNQGRLGVVIVVIAGLLTLATVTAAARRSMLTHAARGRSDRADGEGRLSRLVAVLAYVLGVSAIGFLVVVVLRGRAHPSSAWASDPWAASVAVTVILGLTGVVLGAPALIAVLGRAVASRVAPRYALGLHGSAFRIAAGRRLIGFVACVVMLGGLSAAILAGLHRTAFGDDAQATITFDISQISGGGPDWVDKLPRHPWSIETSETGTDGRGVTHPYEVLIGDCPAIERADDFVLSHPGPCRDEIQRAGLASVAAGARSVRIGGQTIELPRGPAPEHRAPADDTRSPFADGHVWDLKFPVRDAPWVRRLSQGWLTYWVGRDDGSYRAVLAALSARFPGLQVNAGLQDEERYALYRQQVGTVRAAAALGVLLAAFSFLLTSLESRWERTRSVAALAAIGAPSRVLRTANLVEFTFPVLVAALPASVVGILGGWSVLSFWGTDGMFSSQVPLWSLAGLGSAVLLAAAAGWATGHSDFDREALADQ